MTRLKTSMAAGAGALAILAGGAEAQTSRAPLAGETGAAPQVQIEGSALGTLHYTHTKDADGEGRGKTEVDFSDSALSIGASQRLYRGKAIGSMVIGFSATGDDDEDGGSAPGLFLDQAYVDFQNRTTEVFIGRTGLGSEMAAFPTIRDDDLLGLTQLYNPFSDGRRDEDHSAGNVAGVTLNGNLKHFVTLYGQHQLNTAEDAGGDGINSGGVTFQYFAPPGLEGLDRVPHWGVGYERRAVPERHGGASNAVFATGVVNLRPSTVRLVDLRLFAATTFGNDTETFANQTDAFRADATSVAAALRLLKTPYGQPASQVSLTAGYRTYHNVDDATQFGVALTGVKRLGAGLDFVTQYSWQQRGDALAAVMGGRSEHRVEVGLAFNFENTFNKHISPRRTLLNVRHQYIPE